MQRFDAGHGGVQVAVDTAGFDDAHGASDA
jgi:hypothetical protein